MLKKKNSLALDSIGPELSVVLIAMAGILVYSNTFTCSFHLDDTLSIVDNHAIRNINNIPILWYRTPTRIFAYWTFALNYHFNGLNVTGYHIVNIAIHLLSGISLWWLIQLLFTTPVLRETSAARHKKTLALIGALIFVVHPLQTQAVTYIVQRLASLAGLMYLVSLGCYIRARLEEHDAKTRNRFFLFSMVSAFLGMVSKETTFTLPLAIVLYELFFMKGKSGIRWYIISAGIGLSILGPLVFVFLRKVPTTVTENVSRIEYLFTQFTVIPRYMRLLILPLYQNLDYDIEVVRSLSNPWALAGLALILAVLAIGVIAYQRYRLLSFGIFWFFLTLAVESSIIPITDVMFEHRLYLPMAGFCFVVIVLIDEGSRIISRPVIRFTAGVIILLFGVLTYARNEVWKDDLSLWNDCVEKSPAKPRVYLNRGSTYYKKGMLDKAMADYETVLRLSPDNWTAYSNMGSVYELRGDYDKAIAMFTKTIEVSKKKSPETYLNRANNFIRKERYAEAIRDLDIYLTRRRDDAPVFYRRGSLQRLLNNSEGAINDFTRAITLDSLQGSYYFERGVLYNQTGRLDEALSDYDAAIQRGSRSVDCHINKGFILAQRGLYKKAIEEYTLALQYQPNSARVLHDRGLTRYRDKQYHEALEDLNSAIRIDSLSPLLFKNRSIIYRAMGEQKKAEEDARRAENLSLSGVR